MEGKLPLAWELVREHLCRENRGRLNNILTVDMGMSTDDANRLIARSDDYQVWLALMEWREWFVE